jgi:hypothetical protein
MELKCSLFGHDYADYDVERERADHGTEVVSTVRTTEACRRCGHARVLSENTEIAAATVPESPDSPEREASKRPASATTANESGGVADSAARSNARPENGYRETDGTDRSAGTRTGPDALSPAGERSPSSVDPTAATRGNRSLEASELRCPACEFAEPVLGSALRAGDSCPACTRGYLRRRDG